MNENKYLIVGLGNIGAEYDRTRHNAGFLVADALAADLGIAFSADRFGAVARGRVKNKLVVILKPDTYMNLSGNAVRHWMKAEDISPKNLLVIVDDLALPFGTLRLKGQGSAGGHNGLKNIEALLGTSGYARLRFGIGNDFPRGGQIDFVLERFTPDEESHFPELLKTGVETVKSFMLAGLERTMNAFNTRHKDTTGQTEKS